MSQLAEFEARMAAAREEREAREAAKTLAERAEDALKEAQRILTNCPHSLDVEHAKARAERTGRRHRTKRTPNRAWRTSRDGRH